MAVADALTVGASGSAPRSTLTFAGSLLVIAGILMPFGEVIAVLGPSGLTSLPVWLVLLHPVGALLLVGGSIVLAVGVRGERGLVGLALGPRVALVVSALAPLLLAWGYVSLLDAAYSSVTFWVFVILLSLCTVASVIVAARVLRAGDVRGPARWGVLLLAVVGLVTSVGGPLSSIALLSLAALVVQPAVIVAAGVLMVVGRARLERADP